MTPTLRQRLTGAWLYLRGAPVTKQDAHRPARAVSLFPGLGQQPLWTTQDLQSFIDSGFNLNAVINAACMYRADAVNTAQLRGYTGTPDQAEALPPADPLARLLEFPNLYQSAAEFHALNSVFFALAGQSFIWLRRDKAGGVPTAMYTLRPDRVKIVPARAGQDDFVLGYVYVREGQAIHDGQPLLPEDVIHARRPNPGDPLLGAGYGFSPLSSAAQSANVDNDVTKFLKVFFQSGAMFQNVVSFEGSHTPEELGAVRERLKEIYGGTENWNEWGVFSDGAKVSRVSPTFDEMGFDAIDARNEARMLMALGVPPILVGARLGLERSTYANYLEGRRAFWEDRLLPELRLFEGKYKSRLNTDTTFVKYDFSDVPALRRDIPALATAAYQLWRMGVPARQAFTTTGLEVGTFEGEDQSYINITGGSQVLPAQVAPEADQAAESVTSQVAAPPKALIRKGYDPQDMAQKVDRVAVAWEDRFGNKANQQFREEQRAISAMLTEMQQDAYRRKATPRWRELIGTIGDWYEKERPEDWRAAFVPLMEGVMTDAGQEWAAALGVTWDVRNLAGEAWFQDYTLQFAQPITDTSAASVKAVLEQALAEGWTIPQTDARLKQVFDQWMQGDLSPEDFEWFEQRLPPYRRELISRTETIRASNAGAYNLSREWGAKKKAWQATYDDRTRGDHLDAMAIYGPGGAIGRIPIEDDFIVGGKEMAYPGDLRGGPGQICNCRCTPLFYMD